MVFFEMKHQNMKTVLIAGGSGLIGTYLTEKLLLLGCSVRWLGRNTSKKCPKGVRIYFWDPFENKIDTAAFEGVDTLINLAGAGVADEKWSTARKQYVIESRTRSAKLLIDTISLGDFPILKFVLNASAIGYYGDQGEQLLTVENPPAQTFLAQVCQQWEQSAKGFESLGLSLSVLRIGVVLTKKGGALEKMKQPVFWGVGAPLGTGCQYLSWVHVEDLTALIIFLCQERKKGVFNGVSPNPVTNKTFTKVLAKVLHRPLLLPNVPSFVLKVLLGEMSAVVLESQRVSEAPNQEIGFQYKFPNLHLALNDLL